MAAPLPRLVEKQIPSFNSDGTVFDIAAPDQASVCFIDMASTLSKMARFNGRNRGIAYSVAQHLVMGARAVELEGGSRHDAALFLLHDGHEWIVGDLIRPIQALYSSLSASIAFGKMVEHVKSAWDEVIYPAAGLSSPSAWTAREKKLVKAMDDRMCAAESIALFGPRAASQYPHYAEIRDKPRTEGAIRPWPAMLAEEKFIQALHRLIGQERVVEQAAIAAAARELR